MQTPTAPLRHTQSLFVLAAALVVASTPAATNADGSSVLLSRDGFLVQQWETDVPVIDLLELLLDEGIPLFITSDLMLHLYHLVFDAVLQDIEAREFHPALVRLTATLLEASELQYETSTGDIREATRRNVAYSYVALHLLGEDFQPPDYVASVVSQELALVEAHAGFEKSPIFGYAEDYSQYVPRGHYTRSPTLEKYFEAMMWFGRMTFLLKKGLIPPEEDRIQTLQAVLIATTLNQPEPAEIWNRIYAVTSFFAGKPDDLMPSEYASAWVNVAHDPTDLLQLTSEGTLQALRHQLAALKPPRIYGGTGGAAFLPNADGEDLYELLDATVGLRVMGLYLR